MAAFDDFLAYLRALKKRSAARGSSPTTVRRQERRDKNRIIKALAARMDRREEFEKDLITMVKFANLEIRRLEDRCSALEEQNKLRAEAKKMKKAAKKRKENKKQQMKQSEAKKPEIKKSKTKKSDINAPEVETGVCNLSKDSITCSDGSGSRVRSLRPRLQAQDYYDPDPFYSYDNPFDPNYSGGSRDPGSDSSDDSDDSLDSHDSDNLDNKLELWQYLGKQNNGGNS
ncbi:hypothetical protein F5X68DRAFT_247118 [Plectosphaerella plurivora]|uniref:Uncharacterized protein n=1 Tax=Plectosphaerella plurivora TaxID=936078 RepID=A0A9P8V4H6_9PEZI|nr:hypothetical protein F5X68DRAFT_247118 [Plectosphaerella plurivora]